MIVGNLMWLQVTLFGSVGYSFMRANLSYSLVFDIAAAFDCIPSRWYQVLVCLGVVVFPLYVLIVRWILNVVNESILQGKKKDNISDAYMK